MFKYLFVLLEDDSKSFCYYQNDLYNSKEKKSISNDLLKKVIAYSNEHNLYLNLLIGQKKLTVNQDKLINTTQHIKYISLKLENVYNNDILIIDNKDIHQISSLLKSANRIIILRLEKNNINNLNSIILSLFKKFKRLNLILPDIEEYTRDDIDQYEKQLNELIPSVISEYKKGNKIEINFLSDRLFLNKFNNCKAGIDHITIAPNGKFYICPGFYYNNENDYIGDIENGITNLDNKILYFDNAPACSTCDSYHCKQCVFLNRETFLEINTPSFYQQCAIAHIDREATKKIYLECKDIDPFDKITPINERIYTDPFYVYTENHEQYNKKFFENNKNASNIKEINNNIGKINNSIKNIDINNPSLKEKLIRIYKMNIEILKKLDK